MNRTKIISGFCPHLEKEHFIEIECADASWKGAQNQWKPIKYACDYEEECPNLKECPLVAKLPAVLHF